MPAALRGTVSGDVLYLTEFKGELRPLLGAGETGASRGGISLWITLCVTRGQARENVCVGGGWAVDNPLSRYDETGKRRES